MTWPASAISTTNIDAGTDSPATARADLKSLIDAFNQVRAHVSTLAQTLIARATAALMLTDLGISNHNLVTVNGSGVVTHPSSASFAGNVSISTGGLTATGALSLTGAATISSNLTVSGTSNIQALNSANINATGSITATANITAYSDERLKKNWEDIGPDFIRQLAGVRVGTYELKYGDVGIRYAGVSAQSLRTVLPEAVQKNEDTGYWSVAYGNAALVAAIHLAREVQDLRAEIAELRSKK